MLVLKELQMDTHRRTSRFYFMHLFLASPIKKKIVLKQLTTKEKTGMLEKEQSPVLEELHS